MTSQASHSSGIPGYLLAVLEKADIHRMADFSDKSSVFSFFLGNGRQQYQMGLPKVSEEVRMMIDTVYCSPLGP